MPEIILEILKRYGAYGLLALVILISIVWYTAHVNGEEGKPIDIIFGLVSYTKGGLQTSLEDRPNDNEPKGEENEKNRCAGPWQERPNSCP